MSSAVIITKFPESYVREKIVPKLLDRDIYVEKILQVSQIKDFIRFNVDFVFFMHEMISHSESYRIQNIIKKSAKRLIALSRKSARWEKELDMAVPRVVEDKDIIPMIEKIILLRKEGLDLDQIAIKITEYWRTSAPNGKNLRVFLARLVQSDKCPDALRFQLNAALRKREVTLAPPPEDKPASILEAAKAEPLDDWAKLAQEYSDENVRLKEKNSALNSELDKLRSAKHNEHPQRSSIDTLRLQALTDALRIHLLAISDVIVELQKIK